VSEERTPKGAWGITGLLFSFMLINFADKTVVGLAAVPIMRDLDLTPRQFGFLGSSFSSLFAVSGILVGFVANRIATRWVLLALAFSWAVVQFPMVGAAGFVTLVACRVLLGAGEGPAFSVAVHALYKWFPDQQRTLPTAVLTQGAAVGVIVALPALNWIVVRYSWHWAFFALGAVGLLWVLVWALLGREGRVAAPALAAADPARERVPYPQLLLSRTFIGCCLACFGGSWAIALGLTWFTPFIITGLGYSQQQAGWISALPWLMGAAAVLTTGFLSQALTARGASPRWARGVVGSTPLVVGGLILLIIPHLADSAWQIVLVVVGGGLCGSIFVVCPPIISSFTPVTQRAFNRDLRSDLLVRRYICPHCYRKRDRDGGDGARRLLHRVYDHRLGSAVGGARGPPPALAHRARYKRNCRFHRCPKGYSIIRSARVNSEARRHRNHRPR
jgi:predicted MFS family arabinose efflux permease